MMFFMGPDAAAGTTASTAAELLLMMSPSSSAHNRPNANGDAAQQQRAKKPNNNNNNACSTENLEYAVCIYHFLVTVAALCLVCLMFTKSSADGGGVIIISSIQHRTDAYVMAPSGGCLQWGNGECIVQEDAGNTAKLWGLLHMEERKAVGLFSSTNAAVVCLTAQIVAMCLTAAYAPLRSDSARWTLSMTAFLALGVFAVALFFMQSMWQIPGNNLMWLEGTLVAAMMSVATKWTRLPDYSDVPHIVASVFSVPMLGIASLVTAGEANVISLRISYVGMVGVAVLWLLQILSNADEDDRVNAAERAWVLRVTPWLCLVPFITVASLRLQTMAVLTDVQPWAIAELTLVLSWALFVLLYFTVGGIVQLMRIGDRRQQWHQEQRKQQHQQNERYTFYRCGSVISSNSSGGGGCGNNNNNNEQPEEDDDDTDGEGGLQQQYNLQCAPTPDCIGWVFYAMHQLLHSAVVLLILIGLYINSA